MPPVVATGVGRIGVGICYDLMFPEVARSLSARGAEIMCFPTNSPVDKVQAPGDPMEVVVARATAHVNRAAVVVCDRHGVERGVDWVGCSCIVDPLGRLLAGAAASEATLVEACIDLEQARDRRWGERSHIDRDRRPELYRGWEPTTMESP
jgi:predicted amidohydrolase